MSIGDQFTAAFADTLGNLDQESQLLHQQICGAKHKCTLSGLPLDGATNHRCQNCGKKIHGPCGVEYNEDNGIITIAAKGLSFEYTTLKSPDIGAPVPHQICFLCVDELQLAQQTINNNNNNNRTICNPIAASATHPSVLALCPDMPNNAPRDVVDEMLQNAMDGNSGPALKLKWQQFFGISNTSPEPNARLTHLRDNFTAEGVKKKARAGSTFNKHQSNNKRFILHLYYNNKEILDEQLVQRLDDISTEPDYTALELQHPKYVKNKGKKSLQQRKDEYLTNLLREEIAYSLGEPGTKPPKPTVKFDALRESCEVFVSFLCSCRKADGGIMKKTSYTGIRSSFTYLFRRYRELIPSAFSQDLKESMDGVKRIATEAGQHGEGDMWDGDRPLTWGLYEAFNRLFLAEGTSEGVFAAAFAKLTCNLACRGKSTGQICTKHMTWEDDSMQIPFGHIKDAQDGTNAIKKLPRNCYCNPLNHSSDVVSAVFDYMALNPNVVADSEEALFSGSVDAQAQRFGRFVTKICLKHKDYIEGEFGFNIKDIGPHSWRKCAHTQLNCGSTAGPSGVAACIRGGHSVGANRDVYIAQERASDTQCGRILCGLPVHLPEFGVSNPDFVAIDAAQSLTEEGVSQEEYQNQQRAVNEQVDQALYSIFGFENITKFPRIKKLLRIGLASHLFHRKVYDGLLDTEGKMSMEYSSAKLLHENSPLRKTPLFTNPAILALKPHVAICMPWDKNRAPCFKPASGLPPHTIILAYIKGLREDMKNQDKKLNELPEKIAEMLDARSMNGPLTMEQVTRAIENGPKFTAMANDISSLTRLMTEGSLAAAAAGRTGNGSAAPPAHNMRLMRQYQHSPGVYRRVPTSWKFPKLKLQGMYQYWHSGDETMHIPPMKFLVPEDVQHIGKRSRITLNEIRRVMVLIDNEAKAQGLVVKDKMTHVEINTLYAHGEKAIANIVPDKTPKGRPRKVSTLKYDSVVRYMHKKKGN